MFTHPPGPLCALQACRLAYGILRDTSRACAISLVRALAGNTGLVQIDHDAEAFPFEQLASILRQRIVDGIYAPGSRLPTHLALESESGLSPMTVRRAVRLLVQEGWIRTRPGRGTFVVPEDQQPKQLSRDAGSIR